MAIAVIATLISLYAVAWPGGYDGRPDSDGVTTRARPLTLPDLSLRDSDGARVRLRDAAPAVVLLADRCECDRTIRELAAAVDPRVSVLVVTTPDPYASGSASAPGRPAVDGSSSVRPSGSVAPAAPPFGPNAPVGSPSASRTGTAPGRSDPAGVRVRQLLDPAGALRASVPGLPTGGAILLVTADWAVIQVVPASTPIGELKSDLERLAR